MRVELIASLIASIYGVCTVFCKKQPLFYRIIFFAMITCLMGNIYTLLYELLWQQGDKGFHVGYLGYVGMFFFLYSSYYGAYDSLADGKQPELKRFRVLAGVIAVASFVSAVCAMYSFGRDAWILIVIIPMCLTLYFAMKHLIIPDVDMGIIKVMRPYNAVVVGLCVLMLTRMFSVPGSMAEIIGSIGTGFMIIFSLPVARNGVRKWFI